MRRSKHCNESPSLPPDYEPPFLRPNWSTKEGRGDILDVARAETFLATPVDESAAASWIPINNIVYKPHCSIADTQQELRKLHCFVVQTKSYAIAKECKIQLRRLREGSHR
jgi:hypothetical protein